MLFRSDPDPEFAKNYINALVGAYVEENLAAKREESFGASRFISEQVTFYKNKLDAIEDEINQFRKKTGIFSPSPKLRSSTKSNWWKRN